MGDEWEAFGEFARALRTLPFGRDEEAMRAARGCPLRLNIFHHPRYNMRTLGKRAIDNLIEQLLSTVGNARIVGPGGAFSPLDNKYVGVLKQLLLEAFPGTPESVLAGVREDLIVVTRAVEEPSTLVSFAPSHLRVANPYAGSVDALREKYSELLNVTIHPTRYLDTDLADPSIVFHESFFAQRSIRGWGKLSLYFARLCASMEEMAKASGLKGIFTTAAATLASSSPRLSIRTARKWSFAF